MERERKRTGSLFFDLMNEIIDIYNQRVESELVENAGVRMKRYIIQAWKR